MSNKSKVEEILDEVLPPSESSLDNKKKNKILSPLSFLLNITFSLANILFSLISAAMQDNGHIYFVISLITICSLNFIVLFINLFIYAYKRSGKEVNKTFSLIFSIGKYLLNIFKVVIPVFLLFSSTTSSIFNDISRIFSFISLTYGIIGIMISIIQLYFIFAHRKKKI